MTSLVPLAQRFNAGGWETFNIDYHPLARSRADVARAYDAVRARVGPNVPICAMGASAGGTLALLLSVDRPSLACVMSWAGPTDLASVTTAQQPVLRRPPAPSDEHPPPARHVERGQPRAPGPRPRVPPLRRERPGGAAGTGRGAPSAPAAFDVHRAGAWDVRVRPQRRRRQGVRSRADSRGRSVAFRGRSDALRAAQKAVQAVQTPGRGPGCSYPYLAGAGVLLAERRPEPGAAAAGATPGTGARARSRPGTASGPAGAARAAGRRRAAAAVAGVAGRGRAAGRA